VRAGCYQARAGKGTMKQSTVVTGLIFLITYGVICGIAGAYLQQGCGPKIELGRPDTAITTTPPRHDRDSTPNLPLIVTKPKPRIKPVEASKPVLTTKDTSDVPIVPPANPDSGILMVLPPSDAPFSYNTHKKYENGDSVAVSATSKILPENPPADWIWRVDRFTDSDTTRTITQPVIKTRISWGWVLAALLAGVAVGIVEERAR
jgi:hypothetical protein